MKFITHYLYALVSSTWLFSAGIFRAANRKLIYHIAAHFGLYNKKQSALPRIASNEIFPSSVVVELTEISVRDGNITPEELWILAAIVKHKKPLQIFEFGTFDGRSTLNMALNAPAGYHIVTLDLDPAKPLTRFNLAEHEKNYINQPKGKRFSGTPQAAHITQLLGDSATYDLSPYNNSTDLVFIDASHSPEYVKHDSETAFKLLRNGKGTLIWHDCGVWDGVTAYLNNSLGSDKRFSQLKHITNTSLAILEVN